METNPANLAPQTGAASYDQRTFSGRYVAVLAAGLILILSALLGADRLVVTALQQPARPPLSLATLLRGYVQQGARVQFCQPMQVSPSPDLINRCQYLGPSFIEAVNPDRLLALGENVALVYFSASNLKLSTLIADWGTPTIVHLADGGVALTWHHPALGLTAWLTWGDPYGVPASAILRLTDDSATIRR